jgi:protein-tyrosine phosphatase
MIDLHNHLLPGIDDGARKVEETLQFLRLARQDGVTVIAATPHMKPGVYDNSRQTILERVEMVREAARGDEAEQVTLLPGAEVYYMADLPERARAGELLTLGDGGHYLLLELPYQQIPMGVDDMIFRLRLLGITPVMAHPERVAYYLEDLERVAASVRLGALTQVTGASITGRFGVKARDFVLEMLRRGLAHLIASDAHDVRYRPPVMTEAVRVAAGIIGETAARRLVEDTPRAILDGRDVEIGETPKPAPRRFRDRFRLFRSRRPAPR